MTSPRYDVSRFGAEAPRFSPRQSDLLWVVGTISQRQAPVLKRIYEQMLDPKWVLAFGTCASLRRLLRQLHDARRHRQNHPLRRLHPGLPAAPRSGVRRAHAPAGQDRARRPHARHRQAPRGSRPSGLVSSHSKIGRHRHEREASSTSSRRVRPGGPRDPLRARRRDGGDRRRASWLEVAVFLRDDPRCDMQMMVDLCGVDYPTASRASKW